MDYNDTKFDEALAEYQKLRRDLEKVARSSSDFAEVAYRSKVHRMARWLKLPEHVEALLKGGHHRYSLFNSGPPPVGLSCGTQFEWETFRAALHLAHASVRALHHPCPVEREGYERWRLKLVEECAGRIFWSHVVDEDVWDEV